MKAIILNFLGLRGSWKWACRQMNKGNVVCKSTRSGEIQYKIDDKKEKIIQWAYKRDYDKVYWKRTSISLNDFKRTNWKIWEYKGAKK